MARWEKRCKEFKAVRDAINNEDYTAIMSGLLNICKEYAKQGNSIWDWGDDFERLAEDMEIDLEDVDEELVNYYLDEFYDLCDAARVWLEI